MAYRDLLLALTSYPERTPAVAVDQAIALAGLLDARLTALTFQVDVPDVAGGLAASLLDLGSLAAAERTKSADAARELSAAFTAAAERAGVPFDAHIHACMSSQIDTVLLDHARLHSMTLVPLGHGDAFQQYVAERVIFGAGRPTLVLPVHVTRPLALDTVVVAWDFSAAAARAVGDAMPLLEKAGTVRVLIVRNEKAMPTQRSGSDIARHLSHHGLNVVVDEVDAGARPVGQVIEAHAGEHGANLLVMGAFGHSRLRDFVLGGATRHVLHSPALPTLLSH